MNLSLYIQEMVSTWRVTKINIFLFLAFCEKREYVCVTRMYPLPDRLIHSSCDVWGESMSQKPTSEISRLQNKQLSH